MSGSPLIHNQCSLSTITSVQRPIPDRLVTRFKVSALRSNRDLNLHARLNIDDDLLDHLRRRIQINQSLVDAHLEHVPCFGALAAGGSCGS